MEHELTKPSAAGTPSSSAQGCVHSEFCKFMLHKLSEPNKNKWLGVLNVMVFILWYSRVRLLLDAAADPVESQGWYNTMFTDSADVWLPLLMDYGLKKES